MRKTVSIMLAALLCVVLAATACAQTNLSLVSAYDNVSIVVETNLLRYTGEEGYGLATLTGQTLTEAIYSRSMYNNNDAVLTASLNNNELNNEGAFRLDGSLLVPFQYGDIRVRGDDWVIGYKLAPSDGNNYDYKGSNNTFYLIETVDVYNVHTGIRVVSLPRANFVDHAPYDDVINIQDRTTGVITCYDANGNALGIVNNLYDDSYSVPQIDTFRDNGQYGLIDAAGNVIMEPSFSSIYSFYGDYAVVSTGTYKGLINSQGDVLVPAEYDDIKNHYNGTTNSGVSTSYSAGGYYCAIKDGKVVFLDANGVVSDATCSERLVDEFNGASCLIYNAEGDLCIMAADGVVTPVTQYDDISAMACMNGFFYRVRNSDYDYGMIDWHGEVIFPCQYDGISATGDGSHIVVATDYEAAEIYSISYDFAPAAPTAPAAPAAPAADTASAASSDNSAVIGLIDSAVLLLNQNAAANGVAAATLLETAVAQMDAAHPAVAVLSSVVTLLKADAAANAGAAMTLLDTVKSLF